MVVGVDLSEKMLARAKAAADVAASEYRRGAIEDLDFGTEEFDAVISSLALRCVERFATWCKPCALTGRWAMRAWSCPITRRPHPDDPDGRQAFAFCFEKA